jgi:hypothetical protein
MILFIYLFLPLRNAEERLLKSVHLYASKILLPAERIFVKFDVGKCY